MPKPTPTTKPPKSTRPTKSAKSTKPTTRSAKSVKAFKNLDTALMEDAFNDFYHHRGRVYKFNFMRGIFFGLGTFIGGTVIIAGVIGLLSLLVQVFPDFANYVEWLIDLLSHR